MRNYDIKLVLTGKKLMDIESLPWIEYANPDDWMVWVKEFLESADICVIPYPRKIHWIYTSLAKLANYMAASKAVVSTNLTETSKVVRKYSCGLIAHDWEEFESHIKVLYENRELAVTLGMNGRKAAENEYDYVQLAKKMKRIIASNL